MGPRVDPSLRMMEMELHFLHGRPRRAAPERVTDYTGLRQRCGELMGGEMYLGLILAVTPTDQDELCG